MVNSRLTISSSCSIEKKLFFIQIFSETLHFFSFLHFIYIDGIVIYSKGKKMVNKVEIDLTPYFIGCNIIKEPATKVFVETKEFQKNWKQLGFNEDDLRLLEYELIQNPKIGAVIKGTGKLRKMRFSFENRGKSSSVRICYVDYETYSQIYLITVYAKNEKDTLSKEECTAIKKLISMIEINLKNKKEAYHGCI